MTHIYVLSVLLLALYRFIYADKLLAMSYFYFFERLNSRRISTTRSGKDTYGVY